MADQEEMPGPQTEPVNREETPGPQTELVNQEEMPGPQTELVNQEETPGPQTEPTDQEETPGPQTELVNQEETPGPQTELVNQEETPGPQTELVNQEETPGPQTEPTDQEETPGPQTELVNQEETPGPQTEPTDQEETPGPQTELVNQEETPGPQTEPTDQEETPGPQTELVNQEETPGPQTEPTDQEETPGPQTELVNQEEMPGPQTELVNQEETPGPQTEPTDQEEMPGPQTEMVNQEETPGPQTELVNQEETPVPQTDDGPAPEQEVQSTDVAASSTENELQERMEQAPKGVTEGEDGEPHQAEEQAEDQVAEKEETPDGQHKAALEQINQGDTTEANLEDTAVEQPNHGEEAQEPTDSGEQPEEKAEEDDQLPSGEKEMVDPSQSEKTLPEVSQEIVPDQAAETTHDEPLLTVSQSPDVVPSEEKVTEEQTTTLQEEGELKKELSSVHQDAETAVPSSTPVVDHVMTETYPAQDEQDVDPHAETPRTSVNLEATATVKFVLMPSGQVVTLACSLGQTLGQLREHFASELKMLSNLILLMFDGHRMEDTQTLADLGVGPNGTIQLEMQSSDPVNTPIKTYRPQQEYHMPDVITVRVHTEDGNFTDVVVEIERTTRKKPFLGGYRHKRSFMEFHHASAQTMQKQRPPSNVPRFCRDTQTVEQKHRVQQTVYDTSTQMTKIGVYVSNLPDKLVKPGKYTTALEHHAMLLSKIVIIQTYFRRWSAQKYVANLKRETMKRAEWERQEEIRKKKEKEDKIKQEFQRRMNPKTKEDFDLLFSALEKWRNEELDRINAQLEGAERKAALCMLLEQETQLISAIGRHKIEADDENKDKRILTFLKNAAAPKRWKGFDGKYTEMDTPYTIRAKELQDIYSSINMKYLTQDERLDVLLTLKHTVKEHDCKLTQEIIELIDREADLLMRGVREANLDGLRKRISTLYLQYIKTPTFNPEAANLLKVPQDPSILRKNIYFCPSCSNYLPSTEFSLSSNSRHVGKCRRCVKVDNDARTRQNFSHYKFMLKNLRLSEEDYDDDSKIAFLVQEHDLRYLVEKTWCSQSIISAWDDLFDLTMVRWNKHEEWSPWNCIFLTKDEADAHDQISNLENGYGHVFIQKVQQKHTIARNYFSRLPGMAELVRAKANERESRSGPSILGQAVPVQRA